MSKYLLISLGASDTPEGRGRMAHYLDTATELAGSGAGVKLYFAGVGVTWLAAFDQREHPFTRNYGDRFDRVKPLIAGACDFCASVRFKSADSAKRLGIPLLGDGAHHSLAQLLAEGYQMINF